ncbi:MAG: ABC transporter permease subunit [Corynebacteriales bacterium]|nr:ABC transporter permease subunit [Mycobacteriales bacterium]
MIALLRSENLKIFTTKVWWAMLLGLSGYVVLALLVNGGITLSDADNSDPSFTESAHAANLYTSGQYFGILFAALLGALLSTNEYRHQTLTSTFLTTPNRGKVMSAKLLMALMWGAIYALFATSLSLPVGMGVLSAADYGSYLDDSGVVKAIALNVLAYGVWSVIGFGFGSMFRSQAGAIVLIIVAYFATSMILQLLLVILANATDHPGLIEVYYYLPNGATTVMTSAGEQLNTLGELDINQPDWYVGMIVLLGYGAIAATIGTYLTMSRDIG